jgi:uncharacterized protein (TIGR02246 family)
MRSLPFRLGAVLLITAFGCTGADTGDSAEKASSEVVDVAAVEAAIDAANAKFVDALKAGDVPAALNNYAADAIVMMPNSPAWQGTEAISNGFKEFLSAMKLTEFTVLPNTVIVGGDIAVEHGGGEWTFQPAKGAPIKDKVKYVTVWQKQSDGSWKIIRDINNSDLPAQH